MTKFDHEIIHNKEEKHPLFGKHRAEETKIKIGLKNKKFSKQNHPMFGVKRPGEKSGNHKLTEIKIIQIKMLFKLGFKNIEISKLCNISYSTISNIKTGKLWSHIRV